VTAFADVVVGATLPELALDVTPTLIVKGAVASRDFQDVHHDASLARQRGSQDIFMNILTTNGLVCRLVTDWGGGDAVVLKSSIRLGVPNYAGDRMTLTGTVTAVEPRGAGGVVDVSVVGRNSLGDHVTGMVRVDLP
jgi:acyl dehydratase